MTLTSFVFANQAWFEADLISCTFANGAVIRATNHNVNIIGPDGFTYFSSLYGKWERGGVTFERNALSSCDVTVTADTTVLFPGTATPMLWVSKLFARASVTITTCTIDIAAPTVIIGSVVVFVGRVSAPSMTSTQATLHCADETYLLAEPWPRRVICAGCPFTLFDAQCGLNRNSFAITCAVGAGSTQTNLILGQNKNRILWSQDLSNPAWTSSVTVTTNTAVAPDGTTTADTLNDTSAAAFQSSQQIITIAADTKSWTFSVHVLKTTVATNTFGVNVQLTGGSVITATPRLNTNSGIATGATVVDAGLYWRLIGTVTNDGTNTGLAVNAFPATGVNSGSNPGADVVTATGTAVVWGAQLEQSATATVYVSTTVVTTVSLGSVGTDTLPYSKGYIVPTSGQAVGWPIMVTLQADATHLNIQPFPLPIVAGDGFTLYPGCNGTLAACEFKFNNRANMGGFPQIPGPPGALSATGA